MITRMVSLWVLFLIIVPKSDAELGTAHYGSAHYARANVPSRTDAMERIEGYETLFVGNDDKGVRSVFAVSDSGSLQKVMLSENYGFSFFGNKALVPLKSLQELIRFYEEILSGDKVSTSQKASIQKGLEKIPAFIKHLTPMDNSKSVFTVNGQSFYARLGNGVFAKLNLTKQVFTHSSFAKALHAGHTVEEAEAIVLINQYRQANGLNLLDPISQLRLDAMDNSRKQAEIYRQSGHFSTINPGDAEIAFFGPDTAGAALEGWKNSPAHNNAMLGFNKYIGLSKIGNNSWTARFR